MKAGSTAAVVLAALGLFITACSTGGSGTRDEGPARTDPANSVRPAAPDSAVPAEPAPSATAMNNSEAVKLVKDDPKVSESIKRDLQPCVADEYPVDVSSGDLTGGSAPDIIVNVMTCGDAVGVGTYVYREEGKKYQNVFRAEDPSAYSEIDRGELVVTRQLYDKDDDLAYPSSQLVTTFRWDSEEGRFRQQGKPVRNDYGNTTNGSDPTPDS
ncbi:hypothetical protein ACQB60_30625 [Actinomycetota bacterium Odt1-20B]